MERYIGLDAHSETCTLAIMDTRGKRLREAVLETRADILIAFLDKIPGTKRVLLEEGQLAEWLYEVLHPHVEQVRVIQPKKHEGKKSDADDAWWLAEQMRVGSRGVYVFKPIKEHRPLREAVRAYKVAVKELVRSKSRLRSLFLSRGVSEVTAEIYNPKHRSEWIGKLPVVFRRRADFLAGLVDTMTEAHALTETQLELTAKKHAEVLRLMTIPGIGVIRAAQIVATVVTPFRFQTKRRFWAYCGLGIVTHSSSDYEMIDGRPVRRLSRTLVRGLNRNRSPLLKSIFKGAAMTAIASSPQLRARYERMIANGIESHLARLTIARGLAAVVLAMWKKKEVYDPSKYLSPTASA